MIAKSTQQKRRRQAAEARVIAGALWAAVPEGAGTDAVDGWPTCSALSQSRGMGEIDACARALAHYPRGSRERAFRATTMGSSDLIAALSHNTPANIMADAGVL